MNKVIKVLAVDDERAILDTLEFTLNSAGFDCSGVESVAAAKRQLLDYTPDLILLDWMLPEQSGLAWAKILKNDPLYKDMGIILLTARAEEADKVRGLNVGVDDYVTKPFSSKELIARIHAVLRRTAPDVMHPVLEIAGLRLEKQQYQAFAFNQPLKLAPTEFRLLWYLMSHSDRTYSRNQLLDKVWGNTVYLTERTIDVHIRRLRKILADSGHDQLLHTVWGEGYCFRTAKP